MMQPLSSVCEIIMGQAPAGDTYNDDRVGLPLIAGASDFGQSTPKPTRFTTAAAKISRANDIIVCVRATIGDLNWSDKEYCLGRGVAALRVNEQSADRNYIWRAVEHGAARLSSLGRGATFKQISKPDISNFEIALPSLDEQKRIAAILDQTDDLRRKRQRAIDRLKQLGQAIFHEMFGDPTANAKGWQSAKLTDVVEQDDKINYGVVQPGEEVSRGVPLIRVTDLLKPIIDPSTVKQIDPTIEAQYQRSRLRGDEILIGCVGSIGTVNLAHLGLKGANIARAVARIPVDERLAERRFIAEVIRSPLVQRYFTAETRTVAQPTLNISLIKDAPIILPPIDRQKEFVRKVEAAEGLLKKLDTACLCVDRLFASVQAHAFKGEL